MPDIFHLIGHGFIKRLYQVLRQFYHVEDVDLIYYTQLVNHTYSIISHMWFWRLPIEEKLAWLNSTYEPMDAIKQISADAINEFGEGIIHVYQSLESYGLYKEAIALLDRAYPKIDQNMIKREQIVLYRENLEYATGVSCDWGNSQEWVFRIRLAELKWLNGGPDEALGLIEEYRSMEERLPDEQKVQILVNLIQMCRRAKDFMMERSLLIQLVKHLNQNNYDPRYQYFTERLDYFIALQDDSLSEQDLALMDTVDNAKKLFEKGVKAHSCFAFERAIELYSKALSLVKETSFDEIRDNILVGLTWAYIFAGKFDVAARTITTISTSRSPDDLSLQIILHYTDEIPEMVSQIIPHLSQEEIIVFTRVIVLNYIQIYHEGVVEFHDKLKEYWMGVDPEYVSSSLSTDFTNALANVGFTQEAIEILSSVLKTTSDNILRSQIQNNLGTLYNNLGDDKKALELYFESLSHHRNKFQVYTNIVTSYLALIDIEKAEKFLKLAKEELENSPASDIDLSRHITQSLVLESTRDSKIMINRITHEDIRTELMSLENHLIRLAMEKDALGEFYILGIAKSVEKMLYRVLVDLYTSSFKGFNMKDLRTEDNKYLYSTLNQIGKKQSKSLTLGQWVHLSHHTDDPLIQKVENGFIRRNESFTLSKLADILTTEIIIGDSTPKFTELRNQIAHETYFKVRDVLETKSTLVKLVNELIQILY